MHKCSWNKNFLCRHYLENVENFSHLFFSLFISKKMVNSRRKVLFVHFLEFSNPILPPKPQPLFLFAWDYQKLSKIFILQEKIVSSWIHLEESLLKPLDIIIFALKMKLTLSTTHITKVKNTLNIMYNDRKVNKLSETFCFWKLLGIRFGWLIYIFVYWVIFELNQKFCDIFFTKFCNVVIRLWIILAYFNTMTQKIQRS